MTIVFGAIVLLSLTFSNTMAQGNQQQLKDVKHQLEQRKKLLSTQQRQRQILLGKLKKTELTLAKTALELHQTRAKFNSNQQQQLQLTNQRNTLATQTKRQKNILGKQLASAYMVGGNDLVKMLLNQQQSSKIERLLGYYKYINQARLDSLEQLKITLEQLTTVETKLNQTALRLATLQQQQQQVQLTLSQDKQHRNSALKKLKKEYLANSVNIEQLQLSEIDINQLISQSSQPTVAHRTLVGLTSVKGKLNWPSKGQVSNKFGRSRQGPLRWKGITISGKEGQVVKAIHHGKVLFSNWIKGFGLVMIIDHGKGYMTLYGHNQALLKDPGDYVSANEQIALLGQSGGQEKPVLYFELRHKGKAINPKRWFN